MIRVEHVSKDDTYKVKSNGQRRYLGLVWLCSSILLSCIERLLQKYVHIHDNSVCREATHKYSCTVKPVYNYHLMKYFFAFWRWAPEGRNGQQE